MKREDPTHLSHSHPSAPVSVTSQRLGPRKAQEKWTSDWKRLNKDIRKVVGCGRTNVSLVCFVGIQQYLVQTRISIASTDPFILPIVGRSLSQRTRGVVTF